MRSAGAIEILTILAIQVVLAAAVIWLERWRADRALQADLATPGQAADDEVEIYLGPDADETLEVAIDELEAIDRLLDAGELVEAQRQVHKLLELLQGHDEAALTDERWNARAAA